MQYQIFTNNLPQWVTDSWKVTALFAVMLIFSAITIFIAPEILAFLFATFVLWGGIMLLAFALRMRKLQKEMQHGKAHVVWF